MDVDGDDMNPSSAATPNRQPHVAPPFDLNLWVDKSNELMLVVQIIGNGSSCYSLVSTNHDSFKVVVKDDMSSLSALLKSQNCNPELYAKPYDYQVITACNPWILVTCGEIDGTGLQYLWNPFTIEIKTLPQPPLPFPLDIGISF
ncbi:GPI transamidase subunit PIG-U [Striga asiatica]|uniref:GPI transamidase subunit PIG-U n=1 Tax=Striga asiatica TaxID=4170 RepID=A0A5A7NVS9_STRAF|nr:GPI transamidase subunit PIG-U [Striga asiatica]